MKAIRITSKVTYWLLSICGILGIMAATTAHANNCRNQFNISSFSVPKSSQVAHNADLLVEELVQSKNLAELEETSQKLASFFTAEYRQDQVITINYLVSLIEEILSSNTTNDSEKSKLILGFMKVIRIALLADTPDFTTTDIMEVLFDKFPKFAVNQTVQMRLKLNAKVFDRILGTAQRHLPFQAKYQAEIEKEIAMILQKMPIYHGIRVHVNEIIKVLEQELQKLTPDSPFSFSGWLVEEVYPKIKELEEKNESTTDQYKALLDVLVGGALRNLQLKNKVEYQLHLIKEIRALTLDVLKVQQWLEVLNVQIRFMQELPKSIASEQDGSLDNLLDLNQLTENESILKSLQAPSTGTKIIGGIIWQLKATLYLLNQQEADSNQISLIREKIIHVMQQLAEKTNVAVVKQNIDGFLKELTENE